MTPAPKVPGSAGVADGTRTRDVLDHNQVLYQLNYSHRGRPEGNGKSLALPARA